MAKLTEEQLFNLLMALLDTSTPHKNEKLIHELLPPGGEFDECGNYWLRVVGDSKTLFCCHLDTVGGSPEKTEPFYYNGYIYSMAFSPSSSCLGGDDRCGILCLTSLIYAGVPGTYLFHVGEEKGTVGASFVAKKYDMTEFQRAIEFDRRGTTSVITVMMGMVRTCSEDFAKALSEQIGLEFKPDDTGAFTDVFEYQDMIPECTNLSVGYQYEHSSSEKINSDWLIKKFIPKLYEVDWEKLSVVRNPKGDNTTKSQYVWGGNSNWAHHWNEEWEKDWHSEYGTGWQNTGLNRCAKHYGGMPNTSRRSGEYFAQDNKGNLKHYGPDHKELTDTEGDLAQADGLSVFDEKEFLGACNFCGERGGEVDEIKFEGKDWILCNDCQQFLMLEKELINAAAVSTTSSPQAAIIKNILDVDEIQDKKETVDEDPLKTEVKTNIAPKSIGDNEIVPPIISTSDTNIM